MNKLRFQKNSIKVCLELLMHCDAPRNLNNIRVNAAQIPPNNKDYNVNICKCGEGASGRLPAALRVYYTILWALLHDAHLKKWRSPATDNDSLCRENVRFCTKLLKHDLFSKFRKT